MTRPSREVAREITGHDDCEGCGLENRIAAALDQARREARIEECEATLRLFQMDYAGSMQSLPVNVEFELRHRLAALRSQAEEGKNA